MMLNSFYKLLESRKSIRHYLKDTCVKKDDIDQILKAGLLAPTSRNLKSVEFIYVSKKEDVEKLACCKTTGANMLKEASQAIIVLGNKEKSDVWIEDASVAMTCMHLMASSLNIGSCWVQCRLRSNEEMSAEDYIRHLYQIPHSYGVLAILSLGQIDTKMTLEDKRIHCFYDMGDITW